jgi:nucleotide-binding universal stress UspA family protein
MKNILVPTDFSEHSTWALEVAIMLAKRTNAAIHLLHVVDVPTYTFNAAYERLAMQKRQELLAETSKQLAELAESTAAQGVKLNHVLEQGTTYKLIVETADANNCDVIVMGTHGISGLKKLFIGSTTERVIHTANCPVLSIRQQVSKVDIKQLVFASNFFGEVIEVFPKVYAFAQAFDAKLQLVRINTPGNFETTRFINKQVREFVKLCHIKNYEMTIYNDNTEEEGVLNFAEDVSADLIAIATHERTTLSHLINPSVAEGLSERAALPILTVKITAPSLKYELSRVDRVYGMT